MESSAAWQPTHPAAELARAENIPAAWEVHAVVFHEQTDNFLPTRTTDATVSNACIGVTRAEGSK